MTTDELINWCADTLEQYFFDLQEDESMPTTPLIIAYAATWDEPQAVVMPPVPDGYSRHDILHGVGHWIVDAFGEPDQLYLGGRSYSGELGVEDLLAFLTGSLDSSAFKEAITFTGATRDEPLAFISWEIKRSSGGEAMLGDKERRDVQKMNTLTEPLQYVWEGVDCELKE